jgi:hypothetical protein
MAAYAMATDLPRAVSTLQAHRPVPKNGKACMAPEVTWRYGKKTTVDLWRDMCGKRVLLARTVEELPHGA